MADSTTDRRRWWRTVRITVTVLLTLSLVGCDASSSTGTTPTDDLAADTPSTDTDPAGAPATRPDIVPPAEIGDPFEGIDTNLLVNLQEMEPHSVVRAYAILDRSQKAYRAAGAIVDRVESTTIVGEAENKYEFDVRLGAGSDSEFIHRDWRYTSVDGSFYIERGDAPDRYLQVPLKGSIAETVAQLGPASEFPVHLMLRRDGDDDPIGALAGSYLTEPRVAGARTVQEDGRDWDEVMLVDQSGWVLARFHPDTHLVSSVTYIGMPAALRSVLVRAHVQYDAEVLDELLEPIAIDTEDRARVRTLDALAFGTGEVSGQPELDNLKVGDEVPNFKLRTLDGATITLTQLLGQVVVLDFWATWCGPCKRGLPLLQEFVNWASDSGQPIAVYGVDVWERGATTEENRERVGQYWRTNGFTFPTLLDERAQLPAQFGFESIPVTIVIDPKGRVHAIHRGFNAGIAKTLQQEVMRALSR